MIRPCVANAHRRRFTLPRAARRRTLLGIGLGLAFASLLTGCATSVHRAAAKRENDFQVPTGWKPIVEWQQRLSDHVMRVGGGDPAVLSQLPMLRSPAVQRPGRIVFATTDVDAVVPERDGFDVFGLLVDRRSASSVAWYIFIVGTIERSDYRPAAVADLRVAAMAVRGNRVIWATGPDDPLALARYRQRVATDSALRFPADQDQFRTFPCAAGICVEETRSGARWSVDLAAGVSAETPAGEAAPSERTAGT
jgi:hypothetical protein